MIIMIRVELNEKSIMGEIKMVSDSKEEYDEFANKMIELSDLCEKNVNSYIMSTGKLDNLDSLTEKEDMNITNIITRAVDDMYELLQEYVENYDEIVFIINYNFDYLVLEIENALYVPKNRIIH